MFSAFSESIKSLEKVNQFHDADSSPIKKLLALPLNLITFVNAREKMKALRNYPLIIFLIIIISSCNSKKSGTSNQNTDETGEQGNYIQIADAHPVNPGWSKDNKVIYQWIAEPDMLHPAMGISSQRTEIFLYTQRFLVLTDFKTLKVIPSLAKSLPVISPDGMRLTFELKEGLLWDNGDTLTAEDVIFTAKANKCTVADNPSAMPYWQNLQSVSSTGGRQFTVIMKQPYMHNVAFWGDWPIMQRKFFDPENILSNYTFEQLENTQQSLKNDKKLRLWADEFSSIRYCRDPEFLNGMGAYKVESWDAGLQITLVRKKNHLPDAGADIYAASYPEKIIFVLNRDAASQMLQFKSGVYDASASLSNRTLIDLRKDSVFNSSYHSQFTDTYYYTYLAMNMKPDGIKHPELFTEKNVRKAIALLIPVDQINQIINMGKSKRAAGPVSFLKPDFNNDLKLIPHDFKKAADLLAAEGWQMGEDNILEKNTGSKKLRFECTLSYLTTQAEWKDIAMIIAQELSKAGIKIIPEPLDYSVFSANARFHDFDMLLGSWGQSALPEDFTQLWHSTSWFTNGSNFTGFGNASSDALIDSIKVTLNDSVRNKMSKKFQQMVCDEQPYVFLFTSMRRIAVHKRFGNIALYHERPGILLNNLRLQGGAASVLSSTY